MGANNSNTRVVEFFPANAGRKMSNVAATLAFPRCKNLEGEII
jgi:hypothetical protein